MSKRKKNYPDPEIIINEDSADALRFECNGMVYILLTPSSLYLIDSPVVRAENLCFKRTGVQVSVES